MKIRYFYNPKTRETLTIRGESLRVAPWLSSGLKELSKEEYEKKGGTKVLQKAKRKEPERAEKAED